MCFHIKLSSFLSSFLSLKKITASIADLKIGTFSSLGPCVSCYCKYAADVALQKDVKSDVFIRSGIGGTPRFCAQLVGLNWSRP